MTEYVKHRRNDDHWYSPPFYTGPGGYKLCIRVAANGQGAGAGTHVSVFVHLMRGEYDDRLVWPFRGDITIQLVNQKSDREHFERTFNFDNFVFSQRVMAGKIAPIAHAQGYVQFFSHKSTAQFCTDNDRLKFRVIKIVFHSV